MRRRLVFFTLATFIVAAGPARADGDPDGAKKHFDAGRKLRDDGDCTKAIPEFEKSLASDASIGAYYNLGFCQEQLGLRQEAYDAYRRAKEMASARKDERLKEISGALAALLETPNVRLVLPQPPPGGLQIFVDGELVSPDRYLNETVVFTKPSPSHEVRVTAPGFEELRASVATRELKAIELKPATTTTTAPPPTAAAPATPGPRWTWQHWTGLGLIGGGVVTAAIGGVLLLSYVVREGSLSSDYTSADDACKKDGGDACLRRRDAGIAYNENEQEIRDRIPLLVGLGVGTAALAGAGVTLFVLAKPASEPTSDKALTRAPAVALTPALAPTYQGLSLRGTF